MPKIAVIGSRLISSYDDYESVQAKLDYFLKNMEDITIVSGGAKGLDTLAEKYAEERGYKMKVYLPDYEKYSGKVAPIKRNTTIMENSNYCIAFTRNESKGTAHAIKEAKRLGLNIRIVEL